MDNERMCLGLYPGFQNKTKKRKEGERDERLGGGPQGRGTVEGQCEPLRAAEQG